MTIYKKGLAEYFQPAADKIADIIPRIGNPNYDMQQMLKKLMASDPTIAQKLANMGPDAVEKLYGKQMRKYAEAMPQDMNTKIMNTLNTPAVMDKILSDPVKLQGILQKEFGILTDSQIKSDAANANSAVSQSIISGEQAGAAPTVARAQISNANKAITDNEKSTQDEAALGVLSQRLADLKIPSIKDAMRKGILSAKEKQLIYSHPDAFRRYSTELDEEYKNIQIGFEQQRMKLDAAYKAHQINQDSYANQINRLEMQVEFGRAARLADGSMGTVDVKTMRDLISSPGEVNRQLGITEEPKDPKAKAMWKAAKEVKRQGEAQSEEVLMEARNKFEIRMGAEFAILRKEGGDAQKEAALGRVNAEAQKWFAGKGPIPVYKYDEKNPALGTNWHGGKEKTFYEAGPAETISSTEDSRITWWRSQGSATRKAELKKITDPVERQNTINTLKKYGIEI